MKTVKKILHENFIDRGPARDGQKDERKGGKSSPHPQHEAQGGGWRKREGM